MNRLVGRSIGASLWALSALLLPLQFVVALSWPDGYSLTRNAISDLGVTTCGTFVDGSAPTRIVCSPLHDLFNVGLVASGAMTVIGSFLLAAAVVSQSARAGVALIGVSGVLVVVVGLAPWDALPDVHDGAALGQAVAQWAGMLLLAKAVGPGAWRSLTLAAVLLSVAALVVFVSAIEGARAPFVPFGVAERLAFDTLTVWTAAAGAAVLIRADAFQRRPVAPMNPTSSAAR